MTEIIEPTAATDPATCRASFKRELQRAVREYPGRVRLIDRWRVSRVLRRDDLAELVEERCVEIGLAAGLILPGDLDDRGLLVRDWSSFFQMLIDNLPAILEFISGLLAIFAMF